MENHVRVRFAPSPTGPLHIGGVRTALFNYLFARQNNGTFILRIEDTDQARYIKGAEEYISESLKWCGITVDEGVKVGGAHAPYRQSERKEKYKIFVDQLLAENKAYFAFDTYEELEKLRKEAELDKRIFSYDYHLRENKNKVKNSFTLGEEEAKKIVNSGNPYVIRFKIPENKDIHANDIVRGHVVFHSNTLDDKVIFKSDGLPTYHLANVTDDHLMEITHVIRGEEWLPSLPLHILLYEAFGWEKPKFAHLPLILKPSGQGKLSKRDGDKDGFPVFPLEWKSPEGEISSGYRESGYLPEAVVNMLAFLGWNPGTEQELFTMDELIKSFSLEKVQKAGARFDPEKAKWFNHQHILRLINKKKIKRLLDELIKFFIKSTILYDFYNTECQHDFIRTIYTYKKTLSTKFLKKLIKLTSERINLINDYWYLNKYFFEAPKTYDEKVIQKFWKEETPELMNEISHIILSVNPFKAHLLEEKLKEFIESRNLGFGKVMNPLRLLLVGSNIGPHLFDIMEILGREETLKRIENGLKSMNK